MRMQSWVHWGRTGRLVGAWILALVLSTPSWAQSEVGIGMGAYTPSGSGQVVLEAEWASWIAEAIGVRGIVPDDAPPDELFGLLCADRGQVEEVGSLSRSQDASPGVLWPGVPMGDVQGDELVQRHAEGVDVGPPVESTAAGDQLLGSHGIG